MSLRNLDNLPLCSMSAILRMLAVITAPRRAPLVARIERSFESSLLRFVSSFVFSLGGTSLSSVLRLEALASDELPLLGESVEPRNWLAIVDEKQSLHGNGF